MQSSSLSPIPRAEHAYRLRTTKPILTAMVFVIEDERHAEIVGRFRRWLAAEAELRRLATLPWDEPPNLCPCTGWRTCERLYYMVEYDDAAAPWRKVQEQARLGIFAEGVFWLPAATPS